MTQTSTIFWPAEEERKAGFCYGWSLPGKACVAGVLNSDTEDEAKRLLSKIQWTQEPAPTVLRNLDLARGNIIYYHRHRSNSLRFYALDNDSSKPSLGLDRTVIDRLNVAHRVYSKVNNRPILHHKPTAGLLLHVAAILVRPILSCLHHFSLPLLPFLLSFSAFAQQLNIRGKQVDFFLTHIDALYLSSANDVQAYAAQYTNFFNNVWLILNDLILGVALGTFLQENNALLTEKVNYYIEYLLFQELTQTLLWLDSWPAGLKLNTELSRFYSRTFVAAFRWYGDILSRYILIHTPTIVLLCGYVGIFGGLTLAISVIIDIFAFLFTPHITLCYFIARKVYAVVKSMLGGLWALFRGKRFNVLRIRMDTWEYDIDQLLFGTILFTLLTFLSPTVLVYYALFAGLRLLTLLSQAGLETLLAFMNHFPLFKLMLRLKDPWRIPNGVYLHQVCIPTKGFAEHSQNSSSILKNQPLTLSIMFEQYVNLWKCLERHYNPLQLFHQIISGDYVTGIPHYEIQYC